MDHHKPQEWLDCAPAPRRDESASSLEVRDGPMALQPTEQMRRARGWIEIIKHPPESDSSLLAMNGWLCPEGKLYGCAWKKHDQLTVALGFRHQSEIEQAGFCKLSRLEWLVAPRYRTSPLTEAQWQTISRWYEQNGFSDEHYLRLTLKI